MTDLSEQLRQAVLANSEPQIAVARGSGLTPSTLSRFVNGRGSLSLEAAGRLANYLHLKLIKLDTLNVKQVGR